jgi:hypothetical protein
MGGMSPVTKAFMCGLAAAMLAMVAVSVFAQGASADQAPLYRIEIIVFAHRDLDRNEELLEQSAENLPSGPASPGMRERLFQDREELDALLSGLPEARAGDGQQAADTPPRTFSDRPDETGSGAGLPDDGGMDPQQQWLRQFGFRILSNEELELGGILSSLQRLQAYTPLLHGGWVQEARAQRQANPFDLAYLGRFNPRGTVTLYLDRMPFLTLDLSYQPQMPAGESGGGQFGQIVTGPRYVLKESRRIPRNGELHYFDHPAFGAIVIIRPQARDSAETPDGSPAA